MPNKAVWEPRGLFRRFSGVVTSEEILQAVLKVYGDPRFDDLTYVINDFSDIEGVALDERNIKKVAYLDKASARTNPRIKIAFVTRNPAFFGYAEMYMKFVDELPWQTEIFSSLEEAREWLLN